MVETDQNEQNRSEENSSDRDSSEEGQSGPRRIDAVEEPYHGPEDGGGISAHGIEGETDVRRAKEYAEMIVDTVDEGLLVLNFDLCVEAANESFYRMFDSDPSETEGRLIYDLGNGQWDIPKLRELLEEILPEERVMTGFEVTHDFENVGRRVMHLNARRLNDHQRILLAIEDHTDQAEAEKHLLASQEELRAQTERLRRLAAELTSAEQRERKRLAALLHDDLQQLLYSAEMKLAMARRETNEEATRAAIEETSEQIKKAVETARNLTYQLRPPALYEAGLTPALKWLASDMAERHGLDVEVDPSEMESSGLEPQLSEDMKAMLYTCARELLFNVVKYAGVDEARLSLRIDTNLRDEDKRSGVEDDADRLHLVVEDEGQGFDVSSAIGKYTEEGGFGLLSIRERIAALGGSAEVDSRPGEGTRVELTVPLGLDQSKEANQPSTMVGDLGGDRSEKAPAAKLHQVRVVVADDHAVVRQGIANLLSEDEHTIVVGEASNGQEALELAEQERPDVVLMDLNMPKMNGLEATQKIKRRWPETAVIGLSVQADRATKESMLEAGAAAFVPKTGDVAQIIDAILRVTGRSAPAE